MSKKKDVRRKKGVVRTVIAPRWQRNVRAAVKGLKHDARNVLAAAGFIWLLILLAKAMGGG